MMAPRTSKSWEEEKSFFFWRNEWPPLIFEDLSQLLASLMNLFESRSGRGEAPLMEGSLFLECRKDFHFKRVFKEIAAGNTSLRVKLRKKDEFHDVANEFNKMMDQIVANFSNKS